jgi:hypothetical protein
MSVASLSQNMSDNLGRKHRRNRLLESYPLVAWSPARGNDLTAFHDPGLGS